MGRDRRDGTKRLAAVEAAPLEQLMTDFPDEWRAVGAALVHALEGGPAVTEGFVRRATEAAAPWRHQLAQSRHAPDVVKAALPSIVSARMARLAVERTLLAAATGQASGTVKLRLWSGMLVQKLFFERALVRKPVSLAAFRLLWPLVTQKRVVMPLVQPRGIYCFYTRALVAELAKLADGRPCLELAAGDGTLARFLRGAGVQVRATDDQSWAHAVSYPDDVEKLGALAALKQDPPPVVLCSFPPPRNTFERQVFATPQVQLYVVISTRHRFAAGDWDAYEKQGTFDRVIDEHLSRLVLPPELDPVVLVFRRR